MGNKILESSFRKMQEEGVWDNILEEYNDIILKPYRYTGRQVLNLKTAEVGIVLKENENGSIQVLERINPEVICTHNSWDTLELLDEPDTNIMEDVNNEKV